MTILLQEKAGLPLPQPLGPRTRVPTDRAVVVLLIDRLNRWNGSAGDQKDAHWAFLGVLGPAADRLIRARDAEAADSLKATWNSDGAEVDSNAVIALLNRVVPCP